MSEKKEEGKTVRKCIIPSEIYNNEDVRSVLEKYCENIEVVQQLALIESDKQAINKENQILSSRAFFAKELDIRDIVNNIKKIARDKEIKLKMFSKQLENLIASPTQVKKFIFKSSCRLLQKLIVHGKLPILEKNSYQTSLGKSFIKRGEKGFDLFNSYSDIIYEIHSLLNIGTNSDTYIGHTEKDIIRRFEYHIDDALKGYAIKWSFPSRLIEKAILIAIREELNKDLGVFIKYYQSKPIHIRLSLRKKLADILSTKYFEIKILEKHYTKEKVNNREKWYKENYPNSNGTVFPYGLNMHNYLESGGKYIALPLYDITFMISLGFRVPEISKLIKKLYSIKEATEDNVYARITQFFKSVEHAEDIFLKPVVQLILQRFPNLSGDEIGKIFIEREVDNFLLHEDVHLKDGLEILILEK